MPKYLEIEEEKLQHLIEVAVAVGVKEENAKALVELCWTRWYVDHWERLESQPHTY